MTTERLNYRSCRGIGAVRARHWLLFLGLVSVCCAADLTWDQKFRALPEPQNIRNYMQRLSARPHHVGSPYDKDNAEWIVAKMKGE